uniref:JmjC domain-containing protein n=1 Tax=Arcella intermedia TaxID=1963864 RepID=A0A6B2LBV2_9EUKA
MSTEVKELYWPSQIGRITEPDPLTFYRNYVSMGIPVILCGMMESWPAMKLWDLDYLKDTFGESPISVDITPTGHGDCVVDGTYFVQPMQKKMKLGDVVDIFLKKSPALGVYYIQKQNDNFRTEFEGPLWKDVINNVELFGSRVFDSSPDAVNFWMGDDKAVSSMHKDPYENLYCVVKGQKNFTLLPPTDYPYLYETDFRNAHYERNDEGEDWSIVLDQGTVPWIPVDPDNAAHYQKFPNFNNISPLRVSVQPGEILYLPSMVYHKVAQTGCTIAVNYWFDMKFDLKYAYFKFLEETTKIKSTLL